MTDTTNAEATPDRDIKNPPDVVAALKLEYGTAAKVYNEWKRHKPDNGTPKMVEYNAAWSRYDLAKFRYRNALAAAEPAGMEPK